MTKEQALKKIDELKAYVEKCKEKEIPEMPRHGDYNMHILLPNKPRNLHSSCDRSFENQESADLYGILTFELANLIYARAYLKVKDIQVDEDIDVVYRLLFSVHESKYRVVYYGCVDHFEDETPWFFTKRDDADKVRDYMNEYVAHIKRQMF